MAIKQVAPFIPQPVQVTPPVSVGGQGPASFQDTAPLEDRLAMLQRLGAGAADTSPVQGIGGGLARLASALGTAWMARNAQDKLQSAKTDNAKLLASLLKNGDSADTATTLISSPDPQTQKFGLMLLGSQAKKPSFRPLGPEDRKSYPNLDPSGSYQIDAASGKIISVPGAGAKAPAVRDFIEGGKTITKQWDGSKWVPLSSGPRWNPKQTAEAPGSGDPWSLP